MGFLSRCHDIGEIFFEPLADFGLLGFFIDVCINIHGDFDAGMAELVLDVFQVELAGVFHTAGHVVAQHVEGALDAKFFAQPEEEDADLIRGEGAAVGRGEEEAVFLPVGNEQTMLQLYFAVVLDFVAVVDRQGQDAVALRCFCAAAV